MKYLTCTLAAFLFATSCTTTNDDLGDRLEEIIDGCNATVGIAVLAPDNTMTVVHDRPMPTMSVFKFPVALTMLNRMERENIPLSQSIFVGPEWLDEGTHSPMRDSLPSGGGAVTIAELISRNISQSDNIACDVLLNMVGGAEAVDAYVRGLGIEGFHIVAGERAFHSDIESQRLNTARPYAVCALFERFLEGGLLSAEHTDFLRRQLIGTTSGPNKLKAGLPGGTVIGHKTGLSDRTEEGVRIADNDAGFVVLPDGRHYCIAVFVTDSHEDNDTNAAIAAKVSKVAYEYFTRE